MARTVALDYIGKCDAADPHVMFRVLLNGQATISVPPLTVQNLLTTAIDREDAQDVAEFLLRIAAREWFRENPAVNPASLTTPQLVSLRDFIEAKSWEF